MPFLWLSSSLSPNLQDHSSNHVTESTKSGRTSSWAMKYLAAPDRRGAALDFNRLIVLPNLAMFADWHLRQPSDRGRTTAFWGWEGEVGCRRHSSERRRATAIWLSRTYICRLRSEEKSASADFFPCQPQNAVARPRSEGCRRCQSANIGLRQPDRSRATAIWPTVDYFFHQKTVIAPILPGLYI